MLKNLLNKPLRLLKCPALRGFFSLFFCETNMDALTITLHKLTTTLSQYHLRVSTAESCTGGLIAGWLTELPGSSLWFDRGFVTYSNLAKQEMLGVDEVLLERYGAVSDEVARAMALGALEHSAADVSLSVTGIAGPSGASMAKPVGMVCFAWAAKKNNVLRSKVYSFTSNQRQEIRQLASHHALQGLQLLLDEIV